jgi:cellulose synthase/poly-beta-1,6-N-acetylglucosamine synthase-like glycosyltransferase/exo-beta-1,3-glucanase (GH17 family)
MSRKLLQGKLILLFAIISLIFFLYGFFEEVGIGYRFTYYLLFVSLFFKLLKVGFEWYHFAGLPEPRASSDNPKPPAKKYTVDMLTTFVPGEPYDMLERTLKAMVAVKYPHISYLCDEGDDPIAKRLCRELGVVHVTRQTHENAKAGNVNNALKQATGELCVILDPDHAPFPEFLDHFLHHFDDPEIGYVQVVQAYGNQKESLIAQGAAEQTYLFYGPYMQAMGEYGTAQAIGANCTFRRAALDSIGGHAPGLTEDMHTSMLLHAKGWKSAYEPVILSRGQVPSSISAYYKQQLKWSRGTFDLWFNLFPKLFFKFTWRQKIHYGLLPIHYLFGFVTLIDVFVPALALITGEYPWLMDPRVFFVYFTPFFLFNLLYRFYAQAWLNHSEERGIHLVGGILRVGTWWIFIIGFVYTLLNIKVPYIPTPKEHSTKGEFLLGLPNLVLALISVIALIYGLYVDWQPYSMLMAVFAAINSIIFFGVFAIGQTTWVNNAKAKFKWLRNAVSLEQRHISYLKFSRIAFYTALVVLVLSTGFFVLSSLRLGKDRYLNPTPKTLIEKELGGFYTGIYDPHFDFENNIALIEKREDQAGFQFPIISTYLAWGDGPLPQEKWKQIIQHGAIPMVTWEPWTSGFSAYSEIEDVRNNRKVFRHILNGYFDWYIDQMAVSLRDLNSPVFLRFAHEMENPMYPWSRSGGNTPEEFVAAWKYVHLRFEKLGAHNVSWVWSPWSTEGFDAYFPEGEYIQYVDWIGLTALNYGSASKDMSSKTFEEIYRPFKSKIEEKEYKIPVMLAEFGSTSYQGENGKAWVDESLSVIKYKFPEIKSLVFFFSDWDRNWITDWRPSSEDSFIDWTFDLKGIEDSLADLDLYVGRNYPRTQDSIKSEYERPSSLVYDSSGYKLLVDGEPFYIKGVCYNAGHDWEEGFMPLSRRQLETDFSKIKEMGANTIRRYEPGIYDRNILNSAEKHGLKVMFGFWFDPKTDFFADEKKRKAYERRVLSTVKQRKNDKTIIAWNIGNETWGLLKKHYAQPYLTVVRRSYLEFLDDLAVKIKEIDTSRPVFSSEEHDNERLIAAIVQYKAFAPHLDGLGINSYYEQNISQLQDIMDTFYPEKPYVVTEFGPKGYWNTELGDYQTNGLAIEQSSLAKAEWYQKQWEDYIFKNHGKNLGGMAFSWVDRTEGSATWFGITDYLGRKKPAYYYLQEAWRDDISKTEKFPDITIVGHWDPVSPEAGLWLSAAVTNEYEGTLNYSWVVYDEDWKKRTSILRTINNGQFVEIKIPHKSARAYVYAVDSVGNVITASRPLLVGAK